MYRRKHLPQQELYVRRIWQSALDSMNALDIRTTTVFDGAGQPVATQNALGYLTTTVFDAVGQALALVDARGNRHSSV